MSLFIDNTGDYSQAFSDMFAISSQDGSFGTSPVTGDPTVEQVVYTPGSGASATAQRLGALAATPAATPIVVTALPGGIDPYSLLDVTGNGFTYTLAGVIRVVYDFAQCNHAGIFVFDVGGNHISLPNVPLLYHELSHAFRAANGTTEPNDEIPAETDENVMRAALGLCLRDVNNHGGGCGSGDNCGGTSNGCFIVSATTGSPDSIENIRLKLLRDQVVRATTLGSRLLDEIYRDYYRFSPRIADDLNRDAVLRNQVLVAGVRPLLAWYALAGVLALDRHDAHAVRHAAQTVLDACSGQEPSPASTVDLIDALRCGRPLPADAPAPFGYLATRLQEAPHLPFAQWAIFDPLIRAWTCVAIGQDVVAQAEQWLALAPLERLPAPQLDETTEAELAAVAAGPLAAPALRHEMGARLYSAWPQLGDALRRSDYINQRETP